MIRSHGKDLQCFYYYGINTSITMVPKIVGLKSLNTVPVASTPTEDTSACHFFPKYSEVQLNF